MDEFDFRLQLLRDEISTIQKKIADFDDLSFKIKGWATTLWIGIVGFALKDKTLLLALMAIPVLLIFWLLDTYFKAYQQRSMARMGYIEDFLNERKAFEKSGFPGAFRNRSFGSFLVYDPIGRQTCEVDFDFRKRYQDKVSFRRCFWISNVRLLYVFLISFTLIGCLLAMILRSVA